MTDYSLEELKENLKGKTFFEVVDLLDNELRVLDKMNLRLTRNDDNWEFHNYFDNVNALFKILYGTAEKPRCFDDCITYFEDILRPLIEQEMVRDVYKR